MKPRFLDKLAADPFFRLLKLRETFPAADAAEGYFRPDNQHDDTRVHRTSCWVHENCQGMWRRTVRRRDGYVRFEFEDLADAAAFRTVSAAHPGMIACR